MDVLVCISVISYDYFVFDKDCAEMIAKSENNDYT